MLRKSIKDHPIVVGDYAQWLVSNYGRKEDIYDKIMDTKLKDKVDGLYYATTSASKRIDELNTSVAYANKIFDTDISKLAPSQRSDGPMRALVYKYMLYP